MEYKRAPSTRHARSENRSEGLAAFFTHGVSLQLWEQRGMFSREVRFYEALADKIGTVHLFTYGRDDARFQGRLSKNLVVHPKRLYLPDLLYGLLLPILSARALRRVNAIRVHQLAGAIPAVLANWLWRKPLIVRAGFQWYSFAKQQGASWLKLAAISFIERLAYRSATSVIHTTQKDAAFVSKRYHVSADKITVIPNYVDTDLFKPLPIKKTPRSICYVGRLEKQKNLSMLIEALPGLRAKLVIYGEGSLRGQLKAQARRLKVNADFRGRVANEELPQALNACEIFILPSLYEGNPKVLLEAMACGLPCVGTDVEGINTLIRNSETGLVCEPSVKSLRETIGELLNDHELRNKMGEMAREQVKKTASLEQAIQAEVSFYQP